MIYEDQFIIPGEYGEMATFLSKRANSVQENGINIFNKYVDLILVSAAVGVKKGLLADSVFSKKNSDSSVKIFMKAMSNNAGTFDYLYQLAMLTYSGDSFDPVDETEKLKRAFVIQQISDPDEETKKLRKKCDGIFTRYIFGGLQNIYQFFSKEVDINTPDLEQRIDKAITKFIIENIGLDQHVQSEIISELRKKVFH